MTSDQCVTCNRYRGLLTCDAFPERIPQVILEGSFDHRKPYPGDGGIRWTPLPRERPLPAKDSNRA